MIDDCMIGLNTIGGFPEIGDEIKDVDFLHGSKFQKVLTEEDFRKFQRSGKRKAQSRELRYRASSGVRFWELSIVNRERNKV